MNAKRKRTRAFSENTEHEHEFFSKVSNTNEHEHVFTVKYWTRTNTNTRFFENVEHERTRTRVPFKLLNTTNTNEHEHSCIFIPGFEWIWEWLVNRIISAISDFFENISIPNSFSCFDLSADFLLFEVSAHWMRTSELIQGYLHIRQIKLGRCHHMLHMKCLCNLFLSMNRKLNSLFRYIKCPYGVSPLYLVQANNFGKRS